ncbi:hypothetical protein [Bradyrhizobium cenepequi]|uniref:hypothetical protein n=1 Tax=Bradyrhizobium cenepequi TaxID=2821403 RepID=UPI001CE2B56D|nr:hypothetical protein [Bradyrhizobium cenepequi]MCA6108010.1 hypothetical protein [Bradyrhizobium cenepequi]
MRLHLKARQMRCILETDSPPSFAMRASSNGSHHVEGFPGRLLLLIQANDPRIFALVRASDLAMSLFLRRLRWPTLKAGDVITINDQLRPGKGRPERPLNSGVTRWKAA